MSNEEKAAAFDAIAVALTNRWFDGSWSWWNCCIAASNRFAAGRERKNACSNSSRKPPSETKGGGSMRVRRVQKPSPRKPLVLRCELGVPRPQDEGKQAQAGSESEGRGSMKTATSKDVIGGTAGWSVEQGDCVAWLNALPDDSIDLLFTSPPYELARTYGLGSKMVGGQAWVDWMVEVVRAASPKVKGLIAINCEGQTRGYSYSAVPFLLMADLKRAGFNLRKPVVFHRVGIPGSGGPDWLRNDWEPVVCVTRPGKLVWSENTACGHAPKWAPGGEMSNRLSSGTRTNQWGKTGKDTGTKVLAGGAVISEGKRPSHRTETKKMYSRNPDGSTRDEDEHYAPPAIANPGNVFHCNVGGGMMGHPVAHDNEAPFPLELAEFFVKSFCPPNGITADCFTGSGSLIHAAVANGRRGIGCDIRQSQIDLTRRRLSTVTGQIPGFAEECV